MMPTTYTDPQGHTVLVDPDADVVIYSAYGTDYVMTVAEARETWRTSAALARSYQRPADVAAGRRWLHGW